MRQFSSNDTSFWLDRYGNGSDGTLVVSSNTTQSLIDASCSGSASSTTLSATNASFSSGQLILIHQSRGSNAGNWELNKIASYSSGTITTVYPLVYTYTDSGASQAQVIVIPQYSSVTINASTVFSGKPWNGDTGGILVFFCNGTTTINGTISVVGANGIQQNGGTNQNGGGYRGGGGSNDSPNQAIQGESEAGAGGGSQSANGSGGGGGKGGQGGGTGGTSYQTIQNLSTRFVFGGGGGGSNSNGGTGGCGGNGGGCVLIVSKNIVVSGSIAAGGGNGVNGTVNGGSGGGGGGCILLKGQSVTIGSSLVSSLGGNGGTSSGGDSGGGGAGQTNATTRNGTNGRIAVYYSSVFSGTANPTQHATQDNILADKGGSFFYAFL